MTRGAAHWRVGPLAAAQASLQAGAAAAIVIRPERTRIVDPAAGASPGANVVDATVGEVLNLGPDTKYELTLEGGERVAVREPRERSGRELSAAIASGCRGRSTMGCSSPIRAARAPSTTSRSCDDEGAFEGAAWPAICVGPRRSSANAALTFGASHARVPPLVRRDLPRRARRQEPADGDDIRDPVSGADGAGGGLAGHAAGPRRFRARRIAVRPGPPHVADPGGRGRRVLRVRRLDHPRRRAGRGRPGAREARRAWATCTIGVAFFLAELGDKTMLATITLATTRSRSGCRWARRPDGRGGRPRDRHRRAPGDAAPERAIKVVRGVASSSSGCSCSPRGSTSCRAAVPRPTYAGRHARAARLGLAGRDLVFCPAYRAS